MLELNISTNIKEISKKLDSLAYRELPFATAQALTQLARDVQSVEKSALPGVFESPRPFTVNSVRAFGATKANLTAGVFVMDKAANFLEPFEDGGEHFLNPGQSKLHVPIQAKKDAGGNMPFRYEERLAGSPGIFFGTVNVKGRGPIQGMWQRTVRYEMLDRRGNMHRAATANPRRGYSHAGLDGKPKKIKSLRLLVEYRDNVATHHDLDFYERAQKLVDSKFEHVMGRHLEVAIAKAMVKG